MAGHSDDSVIYLKGVRSANDLQFIKADRSGKRKDKVATGKGGNGDMMYTVVFVLADEELELRLNLPQIEGIKRLIAQFRSEDLPGVVLDIDGQVTEIIGQEHNVAGKRRTGNVSAA